MITENEVQYKRPELYEILEHIDKVDKDKRKDAIRHYVRQHTSFSDYLRCLLDDRIEFLLPEGRPPYTPAHEAYYESSWHKKHLQLGYFVRGGKGEDMNPIKRESMFISLLEVINPEDAVLIADMISKKSPYNWLTKELVEESVPNLIS